MDKRYYALYQTLGWSLVFFILLVSIYTGPFFSWVETVFAGVLVASTALFSHVMRRLFNKWFSKRSLGLQFVYFAFMSVVGALLASSVLLAVFILFAQWEVVDPIAPGHFGFIVRHIYTGNVLTMLGALLLWSAFYITLLKVRQLRDTNEALASSQLEVLSQQLNPHFLFNMLNNIRALILEDPKRARDALARLADMLRYSLQQGNVQQGQQAKVSLAAELEIAEEYVALCKIQFEERLNYYVNLDNAAKQAQVPRMLIQLCIENAIKHGIGLLRQGGDVYLTARVVGEQLTITITNPYPFIQPRVSNPGHTGIGLKNIRERLALLYGKSSMLQLSKVEKNGVGEAKVEIVLPFEVELE
ncbi:MAG TPA: histidine kinase [Aliidiomarina sp.]|nr:histidine kinase [Aliidiomarina sp.]